MELATMDYLDSDVLTLLHPQAIDQFRQLALFLRDGYRSGKSKTHFIAFDGWRSPAKQQALYHQTPPVTKVKPFESAHQYGLAVDFVPWIAQGDDKGWSWAPEHDYEFLSRSAKRYGLWVPITWDRVHVEHPLWKKIRRQWD